MKKYKFLSLLLLPILACGMLAGCSGKRTFADVYNYYNQLQVKVSNLGKEVKTNAEGYSYKTYDGTSTSSIYELIQEGDNKKLTYMLNVTYNLGSDAETLDNIANDPNSVTGISTSAKNLYYAIARIQPTVARLVYNYYNNWANNFYNGITKVEKVDKADSKLLYKKLENLHDATMTFVNAKKNFEDMVKVFTFDNVQINVQTSFCKSYNDFIESSIDFVQCFRNMHVKYIYTAPYTANDSPSRIKDEMLLNVAQVIYMENLKAFNYTNCDLSKLADDMIAATTPSNSYATILKKLLSHATSGQDYAKFKITEEECNNWVTKDAEFTRAVRSFNQKLGLYVSTYNSVDVYQYNYARTGYSNTMTLDEYRKTLDNKQRAQIDFLQDFYNYTFTDYANNILSRIK